MKRKRRRRMLRIKRFIVLMLMASAVITGFNHLKTAKKFITNRQAEQTDFDLRGINQDKYNLDDHVSAKDLYIYSPYMMLYSMESNQEIIETNSSKRVYPASLTKIMTVLIGIENSSDLQRRVTLPESIFPNLYQENASMAGFLPGEELRIQDLLYGAMLPSGAECCIGLAQELYGSEKEFVKAMNKKADELGMTNTHFTNSTGLHDAKHYTSAKDMIILLRYALQNETFRDIFTSQKYSSPPSNKHSDGITFTSTMFRQIGNGDFSGGRILGGKTGYTSEAGLCLATLAVKDGSEYLLVTLQAKGNHQTEPYHILDAKNVYENFLK